MALLVMTFILFTSIVLILVILHDLSWVRTLPTNLSRRVMFMSTGMRQKLALALVLGCQASLVVLDEPTANLDPHNEVLPPEGVYAVAVQVIVLALLIASTAWANETWGVALVGENLADEEYLVESFLFLDVTNLRAWGRLIRLEAQLNF